MHIKTVSRPISAKIITKKSTQRTVTFCILFENSFLRSLAWLYLSIRNDKLNVTDRARVLLLTYINNIFLQGRKKIKRN